MKRYIILFLTIITACQQSYGITDKLGGFLPHPTGFLLKWMFGSMLTTGTKQEQTHDSIEYGHVLPQARYTLSAEDFLQKSKTVLKKLFKKDKIDLNELRELITSETVNMKDKNGKTLLHIIANEIQYYAFIDSDQEKSDGILDVLIDAGIDLDAKDIYGNTPLHYNGNLHFKEYLLKKGADVNARNNDGETPFYNAVKKESLGIAELYLKYDADINICNVYGENALFATVQSNFTQRTHAILNFLVRDCNIDINKQNVDGRTALHSAVILDDNNPAARYLILTPGINLNVKDMYSKTPLDYATANKNERLISLLSESGAKRGSEL